MRGGNFAFHRADLERVDGIRDAFTGWGLEDSDIVIRMIRSGVRRKDGRFATGVLHLWHPEADRARLSANRAKLDEVLKSDRVRALSGLSALTPDRDAVAVGSDVSSQSLLAQVFRAPEREGSAASARTLVPIVLDIHPARSMVDVGCGVGGWVKAFAEHGVNAVGIDGDYVERKQLLIGEDRFVAAISTASSTLPTFAAAMAMMAASISPSASKLPSIWSLPARTVWCVS